MKKSLTTRTILACAAALAIITPLGAEAQTLFDSFDTSVGHFTTWPGFSGYSTGLASSSTTTRVTTSPIEGAGCLRVLMITNGASATPRSRLLSGSGATGNNINFSTSSGTDGWIGCFIKTTNTGWNVQIALQGSTPVGGIQTNLIADGQWHCYEWNMDDTSGGPNGWGSVPGIWGGSATVPNGNHWIDSFIFRSTSVTVQTNVIYMDFVAMNPSGSISNMVNQPCLAVAPPVVTGPLSTNENIVRLTGVSSSASAITIYQNAGTGFTNTYSISGLSSPPASTNISVPAGKLIKGAQIGVTQTISGQEACAPTTGVAVGGGASPSIRIAASIGQSGSVAGPVGRNNGGIPSNLYWIHATGSSVAGGLTVSPSTNWQTIAFYPTDSRYLWNGTFTFPDPNQYGVLDGFGIASADATDCGPIQIYFDNLRQVTNGTEVVVQNFEGNANGVNTVQFYQPSFSSTTSGSIDPAPNASVVSSTLAGGYASTGTNSESVNWQFASAGSGWLRLFAAGPNGNPASPYPVLDLTQPILVDVLLLPVGKTAAHALGMVSPTNSFHQTNCLGGSASFAVTATPPNGTTPTYLYTWKHNGTTIAGATDSSYTKDNVGSADSGTYTVTVSDGVASATLTNTILTVPPAVSIDTQPTASQGPYVAGISQAADFSITASVPETCPCANIPALTYQWYHNGTAIAGATDSSYHIGDVLISDAGSYTCVVTNTCNLQPVTSSTAKLYVYDQNWTQTQASCTNNAGLLGLYWTNQTSANAFTGAPTWTNNSDPTVNFDWTTGGPTFDIYAPTNYFTIRWVAQLQPYYNVAQTYTFYTTSDDGVRLWVNGQLLIDKWVTQSGTAWSGSIALGTNPVDVILEYFEQTGNASVTLSWDSDSVTKDIIPQTQMRPTDPAAVPPLAKVTAPANNSTATLPAAVTLTASLTQETATIDKVEFYNNGTNLLATVTQTGSGNYTTNWTPSAAGVYYITARAYYDTTHTLNTPSNKLTVTAPPKTSVTITSIVDNGDGTVTINYTGGAGASFTLMKSAVLPNPTRDTWTAVGANNSSTPGSFTVTPAGNEFYTIRSN